MAAKKTAAKSTAAKKKKTTTTTPKKAPASKPAAAKEPVEQTPEQQSSRRQKAAIALMAVAALLIAMAFIEGESAWRAVHNFMFGVFGTCTYIWPAHLCLGHARHEQDVRLDIVESYRRRDINIAAVLGDTYFLEPVGILLAHDPRRSDKDRVEGL